NTPVQLTALSGITAITAGWGNTFALKNDSTVWSWGQNFYGQLGLGDTTDRHIPVQVSGLTGIIAIAGGGGHSLALKNDSALWSWGYNNQGQLGDSTTIQRSAPVQVIGLCPGSNGVNELLEQLPVSVFPNPFSIQITFTFNSQIENASMKI